jgi:hypothetical protein
MPIESNPANTRVQRDVRNYRSKVNTDPHVADEVREIVRGRGAGVPPGGPPGQLRPRAIYETFAWFQSPSNRANRTRPERLGGGLDHITPGHLGIHLPQPVPGTNFNYNPPGGAPAVNIVVRPDGAIVHTDAAGNELHEVHEYMHAIFDDILYTTRDLLEDINLALEAYADDPTPAHSTDYRDAVLAFDDFLANLQPGGGSPYAGAFNSVGISPVVTNEGFIVSARVKMNWKNPFHSSSTIKIP